jgi:heat shock protein HslJ
MVLGPVLAIALAAITGGTDLGGADLTGSLWRPSFISASKLPAGIDMQLEFKPDGKVIGSGGCNRFFGGYTVSGNHIKIGPIASTRKGCPGLITVEAAFFATLEAANSFEQREATLVLFDAAGDTLAEFQRAQAG